MPLKKILVPFDYSNFSRKTVDMAMEFAKKFDSKLLLLTCLDNEFVSGPMYVDNDASEKAFSKKYDDAKNQLKQLKQQADYQGINTDVDILRASDIVEKITEYAKQKKIDLIMMGTHGRTGFEKLLFGSKSEETLHNVDCPVMIVK